MNYDLSNDDFSYQLKIKPEPETLDLSFAGDIQHVDCEEYSSQGSNDYVSDCEHSHLDYLTYSSYHHPPYGGSLDSPVEVRTTTSSQDLSYGGLEVEEPGSPKKICLVCSDAASGLHYGVASCEACKAFFKRTVQGNIEYVCPAFGNCEITKRRRKACQACRFQKCLTVGMLKEGVRLDRVRGGRQKYVRVGGSMSTSKGVVKDYQTIPDSCQSTNSSICISLLNKIEPEKVYALPDRTLPGDDYNVLKILSDLVDRELVATISWAKQVPGFQSLPLPDQMILLQTTWLDVLCFNESYRSIPYTGLMVFADDFKCSEAETEQLGIPKKLDCLSRRLVQKMSTLSVTKDEYIFLKVILLLNPDVKVKRSDLVQQLRDRVQDALFQYLISKIPTTAAGRMCDLLLLFPLLMHKKLLAKDFWFEIRTSGKIALHKLHGEMLDFMSA